MKRIALFILFITSLSAISLSSCKKEDDDADKFVGTWVNTQEASDIMVITKVNANTISVMGLITFTVSGSTFTGTEIDDSDQSVTTITGALGGNIITVTGVERNTQGIITDTYNVSYIKM